MAKTGSNDEHHCYKLHMVTNANYSHPLARSSPMLNGNTFQDYPG